MSKKKSDCNDKNREVDVVIIGSGFGGSVAALRLIEKGYSVVVLEAGKRHDAKTLPESSWNIRSFLWAPLVRCFGIQRISLLRNVLVLSGAGVGGGSLVYANTLYEPLDAFYEDLQWSHITNWKEELAPYYRKAKYMLGVTQNPTKTKADAILQAVAKEMDIENTYTPTQVGVFFGEPGKNVSDPYFGGIGPDRTGCIECGQCMTGCRHGAKNTLLQNYLYFAEKAGVQIVDMCTVTDVVEEANHGSGTQNNKYIVTTKRSDTIFSKKETQFVASKVIFAAGTLGTQKLLHRLKQKGSLPNISSQLGVSTRTNSEAILAARTTEPGTDFTEGVAITSSIHPDHETHVEVVRYGKKSNLMGLLTTVLVDGNINGEKTPRVVRWVKEIIKNPKAFVRTLDLRNWSEQTIIALVMQTKNNSITCFLKKGIFGNRLSSRQGRGEPNPIWIPIGHEVVRKMAKQMHGNPNSGISELFNIPATAHILGGVIIGDSAKTGVIDPYHRMYGHDGISVVDGSAISANLGVNPSLTITAQAERAFSLWPNIGEKDLRPVLGEAYQHVEAIIPTNPIV